MIRPQHSRLVRTRPLAALVFSGALACVFVAVNSQLGFATDPKGAAPGDAKSQETPDADRALNDFRQGWAATKNHMRDGDDDGWKVRVTALRQLARAGDNARAPLAAALKDSDAEVRVFAAQALSFLGDERDRGVIEELLAAEPVAAARLYAVDALGKFGNLKQSGRLTAVKATDANKDVRKHVTFAIERRGKAMNTKIRRDLAAFDLTRLDTARVGAAAPDFTLEGALGGSYRLSSFRGRPVVLIFVYGDT